MARAWRLGERPAQRRYVCSSSSKSALISGLRPRRSLFPAQHIGFRTGVMVCTSWGSLLSLKAVRRKEGLSREA